MGLKHTESCPGWTFFSCPGSTLGGLRLPPRASVSPCGVGDSLVIHQSPRSHTPSSRLKPSGLEANSSKTGLATEAMTVRPSFRHPVHHRDCFVLCWRGESLIDSPSPIHVGPGQVSLPVSPQISGSRARTGSSDTHTKLKNTEHLENANIQDLSKVLPSQPRGQRLPVGSQVQGAGPGQPPSRWRLSLPIAYKK